ncbi:hypothetical protein [Subtercola boreus]|uniref:hypothetical protein n=1 Tax=Subtercola boreus TaxID=120213 RepID=UPI0011C04A72|nr:hypothetical protein [Subtercola boreus]
MAIARNRKSPKDSAAIAAFGAAAEARPEQPPTLTPAPARADKVTRPPKPVQKVDGGPAASVIRWKGHEELRDRIKTYAKSERYTDQDLIIQALQLGINQIENR